MEGNGWGGEVQGEGGKEGVEGGRCTGLNDVRFIVQVRHKRKYRTCKNMWNVIRLLCIYLKYI